ncbi:MAG: hypothetical protein WC789_00875 [Lentisphaeria bacterium]|jgi:hypothetical protein
MSNAGFMEQAWAAVGRRLRAVGLLLILGGGVAAGLAQGEGEGRPAAGAYLYHRPEAAEPAGRASATGGLTVRLPTAGRRLVLAFGWKHRKDRLSREETTEAQREWFKPFRASMGDDGRTASFTGLPPDFYDLIVIDAATMTLFEGVDMLGDDLPELATGPLADEIQTTFGRPEGRIAGVDAFFDSKRLDRFETDGVRGAVFIQQMRLGRALAESGAEIPGCIHSIDIFWLMKGKREGGWQVLSRQQLYRQELPIREFFRHQYRRELQGIRVGLRPKDIGVVLRELAE